jgi:hypothetical protein
MNQQYLILIERLVREGRSEREIDREIKRLVKDDVSALHDELDESHELDRAA